MIFFKLGAVCNCSREVNVVQNGSIVDLKKVKVKKPKKPKVTMAEAASKIDLDDLGAFSS